MAPTKTRVPAVEGWFTLDADAPALLGSRCRSCGTFAFPREQAFCRNPDCDGTEFDEVPLSRRGTVWSYTDARYQPPPPYVAADPYVPFCLAAVELADEKMIVLGQCVRGTDMATLRAGQEMELTVEDYFESEGEVRRVWKWRAVR